MTQGRRPRWDAHRVLALRKGLGLTQQELAEQLGVRQQTVSEWETGAYQPRGASARLLDLVAEGTALTYRADTVEVVEPAEPREGRPDP
jgi:DNA-binding transcriptional regulator YiaG